MPQNSTSSEGPSTSPIVRSLAASSSALVGGLRAEGPSAGDPSAAGPFTADPPAGGLSAGNDGFTGGMDVYLTAPAAS
ncbi:hypothetical protein Ppa06_45140 [Planomonospora parontospora subsp. parontospora]|uniref:Uncharacterized protein n=2 Tax=Planomonospora parontospora TaxID=58119 RepID=A0AA37BKC5_9ACTN|nr:hypothetical protein GCM10010126_51020 [Planomonospora parontospora]GII10716.1 hypothetical protein Ppa06_45140 [Planomonospora parontospora subsp. parontospora]